MNEANQIQLFKQQSINQCVQCVTIENCSVLRRLTKILKLYRNLEMNNFEIDLNNFKMFSHCIDDFFKNNFGDFYNIMELFNDYLHYRYFHSNYVFDLFCKQHCFSVRKIFFNSSNHSQFGVSGTEKDLFDYFNTIHTVAIHSKLISPVKEIKEFSYIGKKEDEAWIQHANHKLSFYDNLYINIGSFHFQSYYGYNNNSSGELSHIKPKYKNIKEEILYNNFKNVLADSWNQTLRKSKIFYQSWASKKIRTTVNGHYIDKIINNKHTWKIDEKITEKELVVFKLYTDYDKLQFELKKCFRMGDKNTHLQRLKEFYHWRIGLSVSLTKFGKEMENNTSYYHGSNCKMIIPTNQGYFAGPLSTSSSYQVAKTFATSKGMVLELIPQFCSKLTKIFDASLISDYPEEAEYIIAGAYVKIRTIITRPLCKNFLENMNFGSSIQIPMVSFLREIFFSINLFIGDIFNMSRHLEIYVIGLLKCNVFFKDILGATCIDKLWQDVIFNNTQNLFDSNTTNTHLLFTILNLLFNEANQAMCSKTKIYFHGFSCGLCPFFQKKDIRTLSIHKTPKWTIDLEKVIVMYPNIETIIYVDFEFNTSAMNEIVHYITQKYITQKTTAISKIEFQFTTPEKYKEYFRINLNQLRILQIQMAESKWECGSSGSSGSNKIFKLKFKQLF